MSARFITQQGLDKKFASFKASEQRQFNDATASPMCHHVQKVLTQMDFEQFIGRQPANDEEFHRFCIIYDDEVQNTAAMLVKERFLEEDGAKGVELEDDA